MKQLACLLALCLALLAGCTPGEQQADPRDFQAPIRGYQAYLGMTPREMSDAGMTVPPEQWLRGDDMDTLAYFQESETGFSLSFLLTALEREDWMETAYCYSVKLPLSALGVTQVQAQGLEELFGLPFRPVTELDSTAVQWYAAVEEDTFLYYVYPDEQGDVTAACELELVQIYSYTGENGEIASTDKSVIIAAMPDPETA